MKTNSLLLLVFCTMLLACQNGSCPPEKQFAHYMLCPAPPPQHTGALDIVIVKQERNDSTHKCQVEYPHIKNPGKSAIIDTIKTDLAKQYKQMAECRGTMHSAYTTILINDGNILGIEALTSWGEKYGWPQKRSTFNYTYYYEVATGKRIMMDDLFTGETLEKLNDLCAKKCPWLGLKPKLTATNDFTIDVANGKITIWLDPFLYTMPAMEYVNWAAEFTFAEIKPNLKKDSHFYSIIN